jgi:hypothetical protein
VAGEEDAADGKPEGDRIDFRRYAEGDSARHIAWKLTARKGDDGPVMVRIPDRVGSPRVGALFSAGPGDEPAAELFLHLLENERLGPNWAAAVVCPGIEPDACVGRHQLPELGRRLCHSAGAAAASDLTGSIHLLRQAGCGLIVVMGAMPTELPAGVVALRAQRGPAPGGERPGADGDAIWLERRTA